MLNICFSSSAYVMIKMIKMESDQDILFLLDDLSVGHIKNQNYESRFDEFFSMYGYRCQDKQRRGIYFYKITKLLSKRLAGMM